MYYLPTFSTGYNSQALRISPLVSHKLFLSKALGEFTIKVSVPIGKSGGKVEENPWRVSGLDFSYATAKPFTEASVDYIKEVPLSVSIEYEFSL